ncbi:hypothetical protein [Methylohalobius crimeensis]|uniref:hypothetical protein n=1 Tax=Methylohalobius crimeensis TaxID=244365 RepID=UPI0003B33CA2|nr:hypothetical protein [Methylohalobius crimeensis]
MTKASQVQKVEDLKAPSLLERIEHKQAIERRIAEVREHIGEASALADAKRLETEGAWREFERYQKVAGPKEDLDDLQREKLARLRQAAEKADQEAQAAREDFQALTAELNELERNALPNCNAGAAIEEALAYQARVAEIQGQIEGLEKLIEEQRQIVENSQAEVPALDGLYQKREDLLADLAIGQASKADMETLEAEISEAEKNRDKAIQRAKRGEVKANQARQTIAGLERKIEPLRQELAEIEDKGPEVLRQLVRGEAEVLGKEYAELATALKNHFVRLVGLSMLLKSLGGKEFLTTVELALPGFALDTCKAVELPAHPGWLYQLHSWSDRETFHKAMHSERERLREHGVEF